MDLHDNLDNKANFNAAISESDPILLEGVGHGNASTYTGWHNEPLLKRGRLEDAKLLEGRAGSFMSCEFGQALEWFCEHGMRAGFGYDRTWYFMISIFPDGVARMFMDSHMTFIRSLYPDKTMQEAFNATFDKYNEYIRGAPATTARYLAWDRDGMLLAGDKEFKPFKPTPPPPKEVPCYWCEFKTTDLEELRKHVCDKHCQGLTPCWWPDWLREIFGCPLP